jgi:hypothetical protein
VRPSSLRDGLQTGCWLQTGYGLKSFTKNGRIRDDDGWMEGIVNGADIEGVQGTPVYTLAGLHNVHEVAHASAVARLLFELT